MMKPSKSLIAVQGIAEHKVGIFLASLTITGTIIGGGIVALPKSLLYTGIPLGIVLNVVFALASVYAVYLLL